MISFPLSQIYFLSDASSLPKRWGTFYCFTWLFVASLSREVASAAFAEVGGSLNLMKPHSLSRLRRQRLAAARSRHGSDSPPDCHSLPCRHCATLKGRLWWVCRTRLRLRLERSRNFSNRARLYDTMSALVSGGHRRHLK